MFGHICCIVDPFGIFESQPYLTSLLTRKKNKTNKTEMPRTTFQSGFQTVQGGSLSHPPSCRGLPVPNLQIVMIFSFQSNKILTVTTINNVGTRSGKSSIFAENSDESVRVLHQIRRGKTRSLKIHLREQTNYTKAYQLRQGGFLYFMQHDCTMKGRC